MTTKKYLAALACAACLILSPVSAVRTQENASSSSFNEAWRETVALRSRMQADIRLLTELFAAFKAIEAPALKAKQMDMEREGFRLLALRAQICADERMALWCRTFEKRIEAGK